MLTPFETTYLDLLEGELTPPERDAIREGRAVPNDFYDANETMLEAWTLTYDAEPFDPETGHMPDATLYEMNRAMSRVHPLL